MQVELGSSYQRTLAEVKINSQTTNKKKHKSTSVHRKKADHYAPVILAPTLATNIININERTDTIR